MWPVSAAAYDTLRSGHQVVTGRATALTRRHGRVSSSILPLVEGTGTVAYDATGDVRASATLTVADPELWPGGDGEAVLSPMGSELLIERGIGLLDGRIEWVPLMVGPIVKPSRKRPALDGVQVEVKDRSVWVKRTRLFPGEQTVATNTTGQEIARMVAVALPDVEVIDRSDSTVPVGKVDLQDKDRWACCRKMAEAVGCEVYFDRIGRLVIDPIATLDDEPVWTFDVGRRGVLVESTEEIDSDKFFNVFIASQSNNGATNSSGATTDTTDPVKAMVTIDDPADPLYVGVFNETTGRFEGGNYPPTPRFFSSSLIATVEHAQRAAAGLRQRCRGLGYSSGITSLPNPLLDPSDVARVRYGDGSPPAAVILDAFPVGLSAATGAQAITLRGAPLPEEDEQVQTDRTQTSGGTTAPASGSTGASTAKPATSDMVTIVYGTIPDAAWNQLLRAGYRGTPNDGQEALVNVPRAVYNKLLGITA